MVKILKSAHTKCGFASSWQKKYPWLLYESDENAMYGKLCMRYGHLPHKVVGNGSKLAALLCGMTNA